MMTDRIPARLLTLILALCLLLAGSAAAEKAGDPIADFSLTDQYGNTWTPADLAGKIVFLNFWATWCGPCVSEMPEFETFYHELGENKEEIMILGVAGPGIIDYEDEAGIASFLEQNSLTYPVLMDTEGILWQAYPSQYIPCSLFFLPDGTLAEIRLPDGSTGTKIVGIIGGDYFRETLEALRQTAFSVQL